ncbi:hypothetical protein [Glaciecola sp. KUL10]|uniref:hypothetical protein n=1 Tax=Glaciecola sp. (strain KUL10) TaxID=2161813 RepID=UPI000D7840E7|nr:hypothetical protein [Glaciecola sp. KUL10]GBL05224.1 methionine--tRNA ligase [Glaciecola sp. KUL10]
MNDSVIDLVSVTIQVFGLLLVAIELYLPKLAERLKVFLETVQFRFVGRPAKKQDWHWVAIGAYITIWVISVAIVSIMEPSMSIVANAAFTIFTIFFGIVTFISKVFVRLGIVLGRGNAIGGVGLVLALIGFTVEISKMVIA